MLNEKLGVHGPASLPTRSGRKVVEFQGYSIARVTKNSEFGLLELRIAHKFRIRELLNRRLAALLDHLIAAP